MIQVSDLEFRYGEGEFRLRISDLAVERGMTAAFIGPSGSGKTTLLNLIAGIIVPRVGRIVTNDVDVTRLSDAERRSFRITKIGLVFQEFELLEYLSVLDNILLPYRINPSLQLEKSVRERAEGLAEQMGIADQLRRYPSKLSQGERQRAAVCRAVLPEPTLLLADEPTGNLDPANKGRVLDILFDYVAENGATLLTVTHDHDLLPRFQRVIDFKQFGVVAGERGGEKRTKAAGGGGER
ncbi:MAG: ABC transporter ATP-binding protein [Gemmatimonadota bacterium]|nr:ABC transporter ATP-binding protein [Candidatus Palauibacterales bacterium]